MPEISGKGCRLIGSPTGPGSVEGIMPKRLFALTFASLLVGAALVGCNNTPPVVGEWDGSMSMMGQSLPFTKSVTPDGKWKSTMDIAQIGVKIETEGTWTYADKKLQETTTSAKLIGEIPAMLGNMKPQIEGGLKAQEGRTLTADVTVDGDTLTLNYSEGGPVTLTKRKPAQ